MSPLLVAAARMVPLGVVAPVGPLSARLLLGLALTLAVGAAGGGAGAAVGAPGLVQEVAIGLFLGLAAWALVLAAETAGAAVDEVRRAPVARAGRGQAGGHRLAWRLLALALFAAAGGPAVLVDGIGRSYLALPPGRGVAQAPGPLLATGARLLAAAVELAGPILAAVLLADLVFVLLRRAAPSLSRGVGAPGGAAARELFALAAVLAGSAALVGGLSAGAISVGDAIVDLAGTMAR